MEAILLAGGLGTRLRPVVSELPKCMAPVAGRPFLDYVIDHLSSQGITRFVVAVGYMSEAIIEHLKAQYPALDISFSFEETPLGTGGAILKACKMVKGDTVIVTNGDTLYRANLPEAINIFQKQLSDCTLLLKPMEDFDRYGSVSLHDDGSIAEFREKQLLEKGLINAGMYFLKVLPFIQSAPGPVFSFEKDYLEKNFAKGNMFGIVQDKYFIDIGIPPDFQKAQTELA